MGDWEQKRNPQSLFLPAVSFFPTRIFIWQNALLRVSVIYQPALSLVDSLAVLYIRRPLSDRLWASCRKLCSTQARTNYCSYRVIGSFIIFIFYTLGALQVVSILIPIFKYEKTEGYRCPILTFHSLKILLSPSLPHQSLDQSHMASQWQSPVNICGLHGCDHDATQLVPLLRGTGYHSSLPLVGLSSVPLGLSGRVLR